ncbi:MAG: hypothetical protein V4564_08990 [Pseudomonadota bacterium]
MKDLQTFLDSRGAKPLDPKPLQAYVSEMNETVIPKILKDVRSREQLAAELRYSRTTTSRRDEQRD